MAALDLDVFDLPRFRLRNTRLLLDSDNSQLMFPPNVRQMPRYVSSIMPIATAIFSFVVMSCQDTKSCFGKEGGYMNVTQKVAPEDFLPFLVRVSLDRR